MSQPNQPSFINNPSPGKHVPSVGNIPNGVNYGLRSGLTITSSIALFGSVLTIVVFFILLAFNASGVNIPLIKITMVIQSINTVALIITIILNEVPITGEILCGSLRYILYICYLSSIFMCTAVTIYLWLVITRRKLVQAKRNERWYYIIPFALAIILSVSLATIPSSAFGMANRCQPVVVPKPQYLAIRWGLYYGWFVIASVISFLCMFSVLRSTRKLMHTTSMNGRAAHTSTEAYRNAVNARANSMRLRSLAFYTIAYPVISFMCNFPQLIQELLSTVLKRELRWLVFTSRLFLFSEGFFLSLTFFLYPAVQHSMRDLTNSAVQYWIVDQEEFWKMPKNEIKRRNSRKLFKKEVESASTPTEERIVRDFSSFRGRVYHFILSLTPEGRLATNR